jgi:hypothetical protein
MDQQRPSALGQFAGLQLTGQLAQVMGQVRLQLTQVSMSVQRSHVLQVSWSTVALSIPRTVPSRTVGASVANDCTSSSSGFRTSLRMMASRDGWWDRAATLASARWPSPRPAARLTIL